MNFKLIYIALFVLLSSLTAFSQKKSVNPKYTKQDLHYLYKSLRFDINFSKVNLTGPEHQVFQRFDSNAKKTTLSIDEYLKQFSWSQSVFSAGAGSGVGNGTAFYVGGNFILTNKHVAETNNSQRRCGSFDITVRIPHLETIYCKEVHYCSPQYDFCFIEMKNFKNGDPLSKHLPALLLANVESLKKIDSVYAIGNAVNYGIQGSKGDNLYRRIENGKHDFIHHAPTFGGSSGSPLLDEDGKVIGINYAGDVLFPSGYHIQESKLVHNYAVPADIIISELLENLPSAIFARIGSSTVNFIEIQRVKEALSELNKEIRSEQEFNKLMVFLDKKHSIYGLKNTFGYSFKKSGIDHILKRFISKEEVLAKDKNLSKALEIITGNVKNIKFQFLAQYKDKILYKHYGILKDKTNYFSVYETCLKEVKNEYKIDSCLFENLFRPLFDKAFEDFGFSEAQNDQLWNKLIEMTNYSRERYFRYTTGNIDSYRAKHAFNELSPLDYFFSCIASHEESYSHIYSTECERFTGYVLENIGFTEVTDKLSNNVYQKYFTDKQYREIVQSFAKDVTQKNFFCFFGNKNCEKQKYSKLLDEWKYGDKLKPEQREHILNSLVNFHSR